MKVVRAEKVAISDILHYFEDDVVVIPTETVYGLAANIYNEDAIKKIFRVKNRPCDNPLIVHVSSVEMLKTVIEGEVPEQYLKLIEKFWPGPLSLMFPANKSISKLVTGGLDTVVVRMPKNQLILDIIRRLNKPLAAPSANLSGSPSPSSINHVIDDFGENVNLYIDGGECEVGLESTVFSFLNDDPVILRPGGITQEQIVGCINRDVKLQYLVDESKILMKIKTQNQEKMALNVCNDESTLVSPGQKYKHYSPKNTFVLIISDRKDFTDFIKSYIKNKENVKIGILKHRNTFFNVNELPDPVIFNLGTSKKHICANIFAALRALDKVCNIIFTCSVDSKDEGSAIMDRMQKAATEIYILD